MSKTELVQGIVRVGGLTKANIERFYDSLVELARKELNSKGELVLPGLGVLRVVVRKARAGRNPQTGERIQIPRKKTVRFRPYKELRDLLNPGAQASSARGESSCDTDVTS
ncbi:MAG: HU family DNA-binding protein [Planctomycetota bacterium]